LPFAPFFHADTVLYIQHLKKNTEKIPKTNGRFEVSTGQTTEFFSIKRNGRIGRILFFSEEREIAIHGIIWTILQSKYFFLSNGC